MPTTSERRAISRLTELRSRRLDGEAVERSVDALAEETLAGRDGDAAGRAGRAGREAEQVAERIESPAPLVWERVDQAEGAMSDHEAVDLSAQLLAGRRRATGVRGRGIDASPGLRVLAQRAVERQADMVDDRRELAIEPELDGGGARLVGLADVADRDGVRPRGDRK